MGSHVKADLFAPLSELFPAGAGPLLAIRVPAIRRPVLGLSRLEGWVENVRPVFDLEVESVVLLSDFAYGAKDVLLSNETERTIL